MEEVVMSVELKQKSLKKEEYKKICYWVEQALLNTKQTAVEQNEPENINIFWNSLDELIYSLSNTKEELNSIYRWLRENHQEFLNQDLSEGLLLSLEGCRLVDKK